MEQDNFKLIISELISELQNTKYQGDLADIGNLIGLVIGKYVSKTELGYEFDDFVNGINHGISIANGTHD